MEKKTTKREFYEMIKEIVAEDETLVAFCEKEIAAIDAKAEKAKERAAAKRAEGDALREAVQAVLTNEFQTIDEITEKVEGEEVTKAKKEWLQTHLKSVHFNEIHIVPYGTPKEKVVFQPNGILFDDEENNRKNWSGTAYDVNNIIEILKAL